MIEKDENNQNNKAPYKQVDVHHPFFFRPAFQRGHSLSFFRPKRKSGNRENFPDRKSDEYPVEAFQLFSSNLTLKYLKQFLKDSRRVFVIVYY